MALSDYLKKYLTPAPNVRVRDVVREVPGVVRRGANTVREIMSPVSSVSTLEKQNRQSLLPSEVIRIQKKQQIESGSFKVGPSTYITADVGSMVKRVGGKIAQSAAKPVFEGFKDLSTKLLEKLKGRTTVSRQFIEDLTNSPDLKQPERDLIRRMLPDEKEISVTDFANKVKSELLPLNVPKVNRPPERYENISLPDDLRGPVANYQERIYESPIQTSAGSVHFGQDTPNYFAHTRIEDMADGKTRRVIEAQSDLFQKGRLEGEKLNSKDIANYLSPADAERYGKISRGIENFGVGGVTDDVLKTNGELVAKANAKAFGQLEPYRNTWHERVIREEVKQAAKDGKTKLQFPTGETAMKIEGLGQDTGSWISKELGSMNAKLAPDNMKVGMAVRDRNGNSDWIITDVLGDGKFKAVPKDFNLTVKNDSGLYDLAKQKGYIGDFNDYQFTPQIEAKILKDKDFIKAFNESSYAESFDISGKVDTENPIYKFYEKEVGRYLTNKYKATRIKDAQGVEWYEIDLKDKGYNKAPVEAFGGVAGVEEDEEGNLDFNPLHAALGVVGLGALRRSGGISAIDRLIAEGKARVVSRLGRDVYQVVNGSMSVTRILR